MFREIRIIFRALFDRRTPLWLKAVVGAGIFYGILPFDFVPDILPMIGLVDDLTVLIAVITLFLGKTKLLRGQMRGEQPNPS